MTQVKDNGKTTTTEKAPTLWEVQKEGMIDYLTNLEEGLPFQQSLMAMLGKATERGEALDPDDVGHLHRLILFGEMQLVLMVTKMELKN